MVGEKFGTALRTIPPGNEIRLVTQAITVLNRMLEIIERGDLGIEQQAIPRQERFGDCAIRHTTLRVRSSVVALQGTGSVPQ